MSYKLKFNISKEKSFFLENGLAQNIDNFMVTEPNVKIIPFLICNLNQISSVTRITDYIHNTY